MNALYIVLRRKPLSTSTFKLSPLRKMMRFITHPVTIFTVFQLMWIALTVLWVLWYVERLDDISELKKLGMQVIDKDAPLPVLVSGLILLGIMLIGSIWLFVIGQKRTSDFRQQQVFVSSVTHELRSPLASLLLTFETLKKREPPSDIKLQMYENGQKDCERLLRLVNQILISARLDRGIESFDEKVEPLDLLAFISQASKRAEVIDQDAKDRIKIDCPPGLKIHAPKSAFLLLMSNLLENAVKYSPEGGDVEVKADYDGTEHILISVKDQGFGLDKSETKKIFRMFHRGAIANTKAIKGTGIGLFIVKTVSKILGGYVWAESEGRGTGSTFFLRLPLNKRKY